MLSGEAAWAPAALDLPPPAILPPTERRRTSTSVRLALAAAVAAAADSGLPPERLETVFVSSNGDGAVVGGILEALSRPDGMVSPTQFHNSVHNAAAGYWGIATGSTRSSVSLGCHDDSFPVGLMQAALRVATTGEPVLFCAYDAPLPPPLAARRPVEHALAVAMVLISWASAGHGPGFHLSVRPGQRQAGTVRPTGPVARALAGSNPIARALPLLEVLATGQAAVLDFDLLDGGSLSLSVAPC
jgi:hypothetical protein